jgi:hypothetical protein
MGNNVKKVLSLSSHFTKKEDATLTKIIRGHLWKMFIRETGWAGRTTFCQRPGTDVMIFKIFSPKNLAKILAFLTQNKASFATIVIITLVFEKTPIFSPKMGKNRRKL